MEYTKIDGLNNFFTNDQIKEFLDHKGFYIKDIIATYSTNLRNLDKIMWRECPVTIAYKQENPFKDKDFISTTQAEDHDYRSVFNKVMAQQLIDLSVTS